MIPAKNRERKCSTCKHYQPSPLWRKGWCRNPLLYDRNTNHLVEADSLACNRTFIDYWEPMTGPGQAPGPQPRSGKPRIAPSIPMSTVDPYGKRSVVTGNTPVAGMPAVSQIPDEHEDEPMRPPSRPVPQLSLVRPDAEHALETQEDPSKATLQLEQVGGPAPYTDGRDESVPMTAAQRIQRARLQRRGGFLGLQGTRLWLAVAAIVILLAAGVGGTYLLSKNGNKGKTGGNGTTLPVVQGTITSTVVLPTPTGFGDATATPNVPPTQPPTAPPADVIAVGGWVQVNSSSGLSVRTTPSKSGNRVTVIAPNGKAHVIGGPQQADGYTWWQVDQFDAKNPSLSGWCAGDFLKPIPAP